MDTRTPFLLPLLLIAPAIQAQPAQTTPEQTLLSLYVPISLIEINSMSKEFHFALLSNQCKSFSHPHFVQLKLIQPLSFSS